MKEQLNSLLSSEYSTTIVLMILMLILLLLFLVIRYKKILKSKESLLEEKEEKIKSLRQYAYEMERKKVEREHEVEKEILELNHTIKSLETQQKEGLKNQVVVMIDEYAKKRDAQISRLAKVL